MTDYLWEQKLRAEQRDRVLLSRNQTPAFTREEQDRRFVVSIYESIGAGITFNVSNKNTVIIMLGFHLECILNYLIIIGFPIKHSFEL